MLHIITRLAAHRKRFVIGQLTHKLKSTNPLIRTDAVFALGKTRFPEAIPTLIAALTDTNDWVRFEAVTALRTIGCYPIEVISVLLVMVDDESARVRANAICTMESMSSYPESVVRALLAALKDQDITVRTSAIRALGRLDQPYPHILETLVKALKDANLSVRSNAFSALVRLSPVNHEVVNMLFTALSRESEWSQRYRRQMLKQIGTPMAAAVLAKCKQSRHK